MIKSLIFVIGLLGLHLGLIPESPDFNSKNLLKEVRKVCGTDQPEWSELSVPGKSAGLECIQGKFFKLGDSNKLSGKYYLYIGRVNSCRQGGCSNPNLPAANETSEYFDYFIVFTPDIHVDQVRVYNYQATHGQEISNKGWLKQFQGYDGSRSFTVGKSIDAISGATISVDGITSDIQEKTRLLKKLVASN